MPSPFVPDRGDVIWISFHPQAGHEQAGRRPALVLSPSAYNGKVGLALLCPGLAPVAQPLVHVTRPAFGEQA